VSSGVDLPGCCGRVRVILKVGDENRRPEVMTAFDCLVA
jgi:hypothetical protein